MDHVIRDMAGHDIAQAALLWHEGWHDGHADHVPENLTRLRTLDSFENRLAGYLSRARVAVSGDELLGFCIVKDAEIYQMYASREARGTGVAGDLMHDGEARIRRNGFEHAWLDCAIGNDRAARFYEKCGWQNSGVVTASLETSEGQYDLDLWRFKKALVIPST